MITNNLPEGFAILVDGGCKKQHRPVSEREMYCSLKVYHNGKPIRHEWQQHVDLQHTMTLQPQDGNANNQIAELLAAEVALTYATTLRDRRACAGKALTAVTILQDSEYGLGWGSGAYKGNSKTSEWTLNEAKQCASLLRYLKEKQVDVRFQHVGEAWVKTQLGH
jgi:ribonuclease HI